MWWDGAEPVSFHFRPAVRSQTPLLIGLVGPSGCGKTYSALKLATGMANGRPIYGIDTEARRMLRYAEEFQFQHLEFGAPFSPARYLEAIQTAADAGAGVIIVDSISHEHEGPGGVLEMHGAELDRMAGNDWKKRERLTYTAWIKPKQQRQRLINTILQIPCNFIFCFRAKEKMKMVKDQQGKTQVTPVGWQAIAASEFTYEMTTVAVLPPNAMGVPDWQAEAAKIEHHHQFAFPAGKALCEDTGRLMAEWARGEKLQQKELASPLPHGANGERSGVADGPGQPAAPLSGDRKQTLVDDAFVCARESRHEFNRFYANCTDAQKEALQPYEAKLRAELERHPK